LVAAIAARNPAAAEVMASARTDNSDPTQSIAAAIVTESLDIFALP
jgi:hypothetical protein